MHGGTGRREISGFHSTLNNETEKPDDQSLRVEVCSSLADVDAAQWNALDPTGYPFVRHEFLLALEANGCVAQEHGWHPFHLLLREGDQLLAAAPAYVKTNSYGEFVFDWAWADAFERSGNRYYPKLICGIPFTPAPGPRLLTHPKQDYNACARALYHAAIAVCEQQNLSSVHWLFTLDSEAQMLKDAGYSLRLGCQYHWHNQGYQTFDDFLARCTSKKRKNLRRERRRVAEQDIQMQCLHGSELGADDWRDVTRFYLDTFNRKWGTPTLNSRFFSQIGKTMGEDVIIVFALKDGERVACAVMLKGGDTLYGRYWGCSEDFHSLHFEACYYQGIDYCIANGLQTFQPGAQGEHKIARGFVPTRTWSAHHIQHEGFRDAVDRFLDQETPLMEERCEELKSLLPFREDA